MIHSNYLTNTLSNAKTYLNQHWFSTSIYTLQVVMYTGWTIMAGLAAASGQTTSLLTLPIEPQNNLLAANMLPWTMVFSTLFPTMAYLEEIKTASNSTKLKTPKLPNEDSSNPWAIKIDDVKDLRTKQFKKQGLLNIIENSI